MRWATPRIADSRGKALIFVRLLRLIFRYTLNNVVFGIALMAATGLYRDMVELQRIERRDEVD